MSEEVSINIKGPSELKLTIQIALDKTVRELKDAIAAQSQVEADRQRLIYSGRVLKDDDKLSNYKIQSGHTIHMVKGVQRTQPAESSTPQRLPNMAAGQNPSDPLTILNTPMAHGALAGFNPFAGMGVNPNDPNMLQGLMGSPQFMEQMSALMSRPEFVDQMLAMDPMLQNNPQMRQMFQSEQFRSMLRNPEMLRSMMQMASAMQSSGVGPGAFGGQAGAFPPFPPMGAFGAPSSSATATGSTATSTGTAAPQNTNPTPGAPPAGGAPPNPFGMIDPNMLMSIMGGMGSPPLWAGGAGGAGLGGAASPTTTTGPPPEERFATQLQQLADMGFTNGQQNIRALLATGGNVHSAIEYILGGGGI